MYIYTYVYIYIYIYIYIYTYTYTSFYVIKSRCYIVASSVKSPANDPRFCWAEAEAPASSYEDLSFSSVTRGAKRSDVLLWGWDFRRGFIGKRQKYGCLSD